MEIVFGIALANDLIQLSQTMQNPAFQFWHVFRINTVGLGEVVERPQHKAHGVAQTTVAVGNALDDLIADAKVSGIVGLCHPQTQDVCAVFVAYVFGGDGVADGFGHLHALFIQRKAVGQNALIGRATFGAASLKHGRMEPTAVLVGAFEV